jgi:hypothetical protein
MRRFISLAKSKCLHISVILAFFFAFPYDQLVQNVKDIGALGKQMSAAAKGQCPFGEDLQRSPIGRLQQSIYSQLIDGQQSPKLYALSTFRPCVYERVQNWLLSDQWASTDVYLLIYYLVQMTDIPGSERLASELKELSPLNYVSEGLVWELKSKQEKARECYASIPDKDWDSIPTLTDLLALEKQRYSANEQVERINQLSDYKCLDNVYYESFEQAGWKQDDFIFLQREISSMAEGFYFSGIDGRNANVGGSSVLLGGVFPSGQQSRETSYVGVVLLLPPLDPGDYLVKFDHKSALVEHKQSLEMYWGVLPANRHLTPNQSSWESSSYVFNLSETHSSGILFRLRGRGLLWVDNFKLCRVDTSPDDWLNGE